MVRKSYLLALLTVGGVVLGCARAAAQEPVTASAPEPDPLPGLPRPPDAPRSLYQEAPATPPFSCAPLPGPYFERDPRLDPPVWPQPGWFAGVELGVVGPHVKNRLNDVVQTGSRMPDVIHVPEAELNWTVSPRVDLGYRLPSGFGELAVAYQTLATDGAQATLGPDGVAALKSRLDLNLGQIDYRSREMSLWPHCGMKWWFGLRMANFYFDSQANEDVVAAAAGSGIVAAHTTNHFLGGGPHYGLELTQHWEQTGLAWILRADGSTLLGRTQQDFLEVTTTPGPGGGLLTGETRRSNPQDVPTLNIFLGAVWLPPAWPALSLSAGYSYEYWWNAGRLSTSTSRGEWSQQGIMVRAGLNY